MTSRHWCFTLNNPKNDQPDFGRLRHCRYAIWQKESAPDTGTVHLQGYVEFAQPVRLSSMRETLPGAHLERRRGSRDQAREYCRKPDRLDGPWEWGVWDLSPGKRTDLESAVELLRASSGRLRDVAREQPVAIVKWHRGLRELSRLLHGGGRRLKLKVYVLWGDAGSGKTRYVHDMWGEDLYTLASQSPLWFDGYEGEKTLLIDEWTGEMGRETALQLLDVYPMQVPVKGGFVWAEWERVFITANTNFTVGWDAALMRRVTLIEHCVV